MAGAGLQRVLMCRGVVRCAMMGAAAMMHFLMRRSTLLRIEDRAEQAGRAPGRATHQAAAEDGLDAGGADLEGGVALGDQAPPVLLRRRHLLLPVYIYIYIYI